MNVSDRLRALDEQQVPRLAAALRGALDRAAALRPPERLQRLDERLAAAGPLSRVRRRPTAVLGLVALLLLTGTLTVVDRADDRSARPSGPRAVLGPGAGETVEDYLAIADARLTAVARAARPATALVSLDAALPVGRIAALTRGTALERAYVQEGEQVRALGPGELPRLTAQAQAADGAGSDGVAVDRCPCVVALLVSGAGELLSALADQPAVRAVEPTAAGATDGDVRLLLPGVQGTLSSPVRVTGEQEEQS